VAARGVSDISRVDIAEMKKLEEKVNIGFLELEEQDTARGSTRAKLETPATCVQELRGSSHRTGNVLHIYIECQTRALLSDTAVLPSQKPYTRKKATTFASLLRPMLIKSASTYFDVSESTCTFTPFSAFV